MASSWSVRIAKAQFLDQLQTYSQRNPLRWAYVDARPGVRHYVATVRGRISLMLIWLPSDHPELLVGCPDGVFSISGPLVSELWEAAAESVNGPALQRDAELRAIQSVMEKLTGGH